MEEFRLGDRLIGSHYPPFIIAEVGINHEGELEKAIQLANSAAESGADCVKFQCHIVETEMIPTDMRPGDISDEPLWNIIQRCELTEEEEISLKQHCEDIGILYLSTPFSREASDRLESMGVVGFKIGSGECNNLPLVRHIARKGLPIILSTGMNDLASVHQTVKAIEDLGCPLLINHCVSEYPTPYEHVRLGTIQQFQQEFGHFVGLSDHSAGIYTSLGAIALGAVAIEKHFTISRSWPGPDCPISIEPDELTDLVKGSLAIWQARGGSKEILPTEQPVIDFAYASVVTIQEIKTGDTLSLDNLWVKRPGTGPILANDLDSILGKVAMRDLAANEQLSPQDFS